MVWGIIQIICTFPGKEHKSIYSMVLNLAQPNFSGNQ